MNPFFKQPNTPLRTLNWRAIRMNINTADKKRNHHTYRIRPIPKLLKGMLRTSSKQNSYPGNRYSYSIPVAVNLIGGPHYGTDSPIPTTNCSSEPLRRFLV